MHISRRTGLKMPSPLKNYPYFVAVSLAILLGSINTGWSCLLTSPTSITGEEIEKRANSLSIGMTWDSFDKATGQRGSLAFDRKNGQTILTIQFEEAFPQELSSFENSFTLSTLPGKKLWTFVYGDNSAENSTQSSEALPSLEEVMGQVYPPRVLENRTPLKASLSEISTLIYGKRSVFFTGAGISAGVVPTMPQLEKSLQLQDCKERTKFLSTLQSALRNPALYVQPMNTFYNACLYGKPTPAHLAIKDIAQQKNWGLLTENLDLLHQRSGIKPLNHDSSSWLKSNITDANLKQIDYVITVGLARDESGFLGWYKAANPKGTIIAFNIEQPNYLNDMDVLVAGDIQQLLPLLRDTLKSQ